MKLPCPSILSLVVHAGVVLLITACAERAGEPAGGNRTEYIYNKYIEWDGQTGGLVPSPATHGAGRAFRQFKPIDLGILHTHLLDAERYVAAHVLLTWLTGIRVDDSLGRWNGLYVDISPEGTFEYRPEERLVLYNLWREALQPTRK